MNPQEEEALSYVTLWFKRTWRQRPAYDGRYLVMWVVEAWACHEPNASFTNTSAKPANCTTNLSIFSPLSSSPCTFKAHSSTHWSHQLMSTQTGTERQRDRDLCRAAGDCDLVLYRKPTGVGQVDAGDFAAAQVLDEPVDGRVDV